MMRNLLLLLFVLAITGCNYNQTNITGTAAGLDGATVTLRNVEGETVAGVNIKQGKFAIKDVRLTYNGYGSITVARPGKPAVDFELYLEHGNYNLVFDDSLHAYPKVTSKSDIQNQLSAYHAIRNQVRESAEKEKSDLGLKYKNAVRSAQQWDTTTTAIANRLLAVGKKLDNIDQAALMAYINKYPNNDIAVHLLQSMSTESDPVGYLAVYSKLRPEQQNSEEAKPIGDKLKAIIHLVPGAEAPAIAGTTPDGKKITPKALNKKMVLVEFWRAANYSSRLNHQAMMKKKSPVSHFNDVGIISISFDKKRDWWLGSMRDDKLTWTQVSDLKGTDSPNFTNWGIDDLPTYYLLDGEGKIIERDIPFQQIDSRIDEYMAKHR